MAKRSEVEARIAALQAELDDADTDDEVWIKDGDHEIKVSGKRATTILSRYSKLWEDEGAEGGDDDEEEPPAVEKPKRESLFKGKAG
jgi:hypothetical protein